MKLALTTAPLLGFGFTTLACATVYNDDLALDEPGLGGSLIGAGATTGTATDGPQASGGGGPSGPRGSGGSGVGGAPAGGGGSGSGSAAGGTSAGGAFGGAGAGGASSGGAASGGASSGGAGSGGTTADGDCDVPTLGSRGSAVCGDTWVFQGALYECVSQAESVNGEPSGCGTPGVYCSAIDPNHVPFGAAAWAKVVDCP